MHKWIDSSDNSEQETPETPDDEPEPSDKPAPVAKKSTAASKKAPPKKSPSSGKLKAGDTVDFDLDGQGSLF